MKLCADCGLLKPFSEYYKGSNGQRYRTRCKSCHKAYTTSYAKRPEWRELQKQRHADLSPEEKDAHKERVREYHRRAKYGLTNEDWQRMFAGQDGLCGICGDRKATHIDHCHETNEVRMLLCNQCNQLLGFARESPSILRAAASYVESQ